MTAPRIAPRRLGLSAGLMLAAIGGAALATEKVWPASTLAERPSSNEAPLADSPEALQAQQNQSDDDVPAEDAGHAARLALYQHRVTAFRRLEPALWPALMTRAKTTNRHGLAAVRRASPLTGPELVAAKARPDADCLAQAVYFEARSEPRTGQAAVAQVVLNRSRSGLYPRSVCGVVYQGADRAGCQFSFACDGSVRRGVGDRGAWDRAREVADRALNGTEVVSAVGPSLNYHADYVRPVWAQQLARVAEIGRHIFYRARGDLPPPGATAPSTLVAGSERDINPTAPTVTGL